jgi:hypothetical protein
MRLRLPLSGYLLALGGIEIGDGLPNALLSYLGMAIGLALALTVILDHLYFDRR